MSGFKIEENADTLKEVLQRHFQKAREEVMEVLTSPGYEKVIDAIDISSDFSNIEIKFKDGVDIEDQNVLQVFAKGGQIKKDDDYIDISPNETIRKYLGTENR